MGVYQNNPVHPHFLLTQLAFTDEKPSSRHTTKKVSFVIRVYAILSFSDNNDKKKDTSENDASFLFLIIVAITRNDNDCHPINSNGSPLITHPELL